MLGNRGGGRGGNQSWTLSSKILGSRNQTQLEAKHTHWSSANSWRHASVRETELRILINHFMTEGYDPRNSVKRTVWRMSWTWDSYERPRSEVPPDEINNVLTAFLYTLEVRESPFPIFPSSFADQFTHVCRIHQICPCGRPPFVYAKIQDVTSIQMIDYQFDISFSCFRTLHERHNQLRLVESRHAFFLFVELSFCSHNLLRNFSVLWNFDKNVSDISSVRLFLHPISFLKFFLLKSTVRHKDPVSVFSFRIPDFVTIESGHHFPFLRVAFSSICSCQFACHLCISFFLTSFLMDAFQNNVIFSQDFVFKIFSYMTSNLYYSLF